jgi:hypothetical protein
MSTVEGYYNHPHVAAQLFPNYESAMRDGLYGLGDLGGFEDDLKRIFGLIPGASSGYASLVGLIQQKAREGAEAAIPKIKHEVEAAVKPFVIVAGLLGLAGFLFGLSAYMTARRR